jgi:thiopurine S-methyltransferase
MEKFSEAYWNEHYRQNRTGWDIGYVSPPLQAYIDQLGNKQMRILVPGAGNAYEVEYLHNEGFTNVFLLDFSEQSIRNFLTRCPGFPSDQILRLDFFDHAGEYDLILEQTFFSAIHPDKRPAYIKRMSELLVPSGKLAGLLFANEFPFEGPPYGGTTNQYRSLFSPFFDVQVMDVASNSIKPRLGNELFFIVRKKEA